jgi:hypothetical protein
LYRTNIFSLFASDIDIDGTRKKEDPFQPSLQREGVIDCKKELKVENSKLLPSFIRMHQ